jgi:hypothetical protein
MNVMENMMQGSDLEKGSILLSPLRLTLSIEQALLHHQTYGITAAQLSPNFPSKLRLQCISKHIYHFQTMALITKLKQ